MGNIFVFTAGVLFLFLWLFLFYRQRSRNFKTKASSPPSSSEEINRPSEVSLKDAVTGLYNHRHLIQRLQENMARCLRENETMALILWDIDGFKDFNNHYGQAVGDRLLKKVGETLRRSIRVYDEAFRSGPDEFCTLLMPADSLMVEEVTNRVRQVVDKNLLEDNEYATQKFSLSSGVAMYPGQEKVPEALLHTARQDLFQSQLTK